MAQNPKRLFFHGVWEVSWHTGDGSEIRRVPVEVGSVPTSIYTVSYQQCASKVYHVQMYYHLNMRKKHYPIAILRWITGGQHISAIRSIDSLFEMFFEGWPCDVTILSVTACLSSLFESYSDFGATNCEPLTYSWGPTSINNRLRSIQLKSKYTDRGEKAWLDNQNIPKTTKRRRYLEFELKEEKCEPFTVEHRHSSLVGGFNPFEKY